MLGTLLNMLLASSFAEFPHKAHHTESTMSIFPTTR